MPDRCERSALGEELKSLDDNALRERTVDALRRLVEAVNETVSSDEFKRVFALAHLHGMTYNGPQFTKEWQDARDITEII